MQQFARTEILIGTEKIEKLNKSKVVVFGIGGVGSFVAEALARAGVGNLVLVDGDKVDITNINRQIEAMHSTVGKYKIEVMKDRILDINPNAKVDIYKPDEVKEGEENLIDNSFSYVVDAIDTISNKIKIIEKCKKENMKIISATSAGNKLNPTMFEVADVYKTSVCPVCKILRRELKNRGIKDLKVVYSKEIPKKNNIETNSRQITLGSISFVPSVMGLIIASEVIKDLIDWRE